MSDNGSMPAYPAMDSNYYERTGERVLELRYQGLSKRELIAAMCLQGLISNAQLDHPYVVIDVHNQRYFLNDILAKEAVSLADALLTELSKTH